MYATKKPGLNFSSQAHQRLRYSSTMILFVDSTLRWIQDSTVFNFENETQI